MWVCNKSYRSLAERKDTFHVVPSVTVFIFIYFWFGLGLVFTVQLNFPLCYIFVSGIFVVHEFSTFFYFFIFFTEKYFKKTDYFNTAQCYCFCFFLIFLFTLDTFFRGEGCWWGRGA